MRILVLTDLFPPVAFGGYELECAALVDRLRERHDVLVLTSALERDRAGGEQGVERTLPARPRARWRAAADAPVQAIGAGRVVREALGRFRPDLLYVSNGSAIPQAAIAIAAREAPRVVCRFSELFFAGSFLSGDRFLRHLEPGGAGLVGAYGRVVRPVNRHPALRLSTPIRFRAHISWASDALRSQAGTPPSIDVVSERVIHPATPREELFATLERAPESPPVVAYVGRVTTAKGAEVAVRALAGLRRTEAGREARLVLAGAVDAPMRASLEALASSLGVRGAVELLGGVPPTEVAALLARAAALVLPTVTFEALGLSAVEAALARVPVVASRLGGIPEALSDEKHALLFAPGDAAACAAALGRVLSEPGATAARVERARTRAGDFALGRYLDRSEELIAAAA